MHTPTISADQLKQRLSNNASEICLFDCRFDLADADAGLRAYQAGHVPGAWYAHLDHDLSGKKTGTNGRHPLPEATALQNFLQRCGVHDDTLIVAYDAHGGMFAARLWWLAGWLGHAQVAVLDGGLPAWQAKGGALETTPPSLPAIGQFSIRPTLQKLVIVTEVVENLTTERYQVIDARAPDRFRGENETLDPVGGHIPNAINRFFKDNLQANGYFKDASTLRNEWLAVLNGRSPAQTIAQCGSGVTACHNVLALELAGLSGVSLYAGSWSEWCSDPTRPIEK